MSISRSSSGGNAAYIENRPLSAIYVHTRSLWKLYLQSLQRKPVLTKGITSGVLAGVSDLIAQSLDKSTRHYKISRTAKLVLYGFLISGPAGHYWQKIIESIFRGRKPSTTLAVEKVLVDQAIYAPFINFVFFVFLGIAERRTPRQINSKINKDLWRVLKMNWRVWPIVNLINYKFVPVELRVLFCNIVSIFWATFLILAAR
mmetsp:Transcript_9766/g.16005  ORF Transcript_9766/g.16005 Transcript_9766/m.16005 type:complete len:202 (-) Transcript_9766:59-664(-)